MNEFESRSRILLVNVSIRLSKLMMINEDEMSDCIEPDKLINGFAT